LLIQPIPLGLLYNHTFLLLLIIERFRWFHASVYHAFHARSSSSTWMEYADLQVLRLGTLSCPDSSMSMAERKVQHAPVVVL
jgi:hypothetical protein